ncbi:MAG: HlyD family secretion protein, partial [Acidobacteria bacterium]|nr:HlyD family secretion protein [Acidobacteriota bacterium]
ALIREGARKKAGRTTNTLVRATVPGMVLEVPVEEGDSVIEANTFNDGTTVATVADMDEMIFEGKVDESEVGKLREGMDLELTIGAIEEER